jgi:signal transduction histidine kinase
MKGFKTILIFLFLFNLSLAQVPNQIVNSTIIKVPNNPEITKLINQLGPDTFVNNDDQKDHNKLKIYRNLGLAYYQEGYYETADYFLKKSRNYTELPEAHKAPDTSDKSKLNNEELKDLELDKNFIEHLPVSYDTATTKDLEQITKMIDSEIDKLVRQRDMLLKKHAKQSLIDAKTNTIVGLTKEKEIIDLSIQRIKLSEDKARYKRYLIFISFCIGLLILVIIVLVQKKTIKTKDYKIEKQLKDINKKNTYLEHAAKIIRHDMHSGINTYMPRGISSLEKRLTQEDITKLKIEAPLKMIKEGLSHTQKVYKSVYEFTNLVKQTVVLNKTSINLRDLILKYIVNTSYTTQVTIDELPTLEVNEILFWNAIDNLIKNGLKYNTSEVKHVDVYMEGDDLIIKDNGVGMTKEQFDNIINHNTVKEDSGLGLPITVAIIEEHGFDITCEKIDDGTKIKIKLNKKS